MEPLDHSVPPVTLMGRDGPREHVTHRNLE